MNVLITWWKAWCNRGAGNKASKRRMEFSKKLAAWAVIIATGAAVVSYVLAFKDKQTASDVTTTIFTACVGYLVTYAAKSATEKISRNRHGLDPDGVPYKTNDTGASAETTAEAPVIITQTEGKG